MHERIVEIILFLVNALRSNKRLSDVDVTELAKDGYTQSEITSAFSWVFERLSVGQPMTGTEQAAHTSQRILHEVERMVINAEAHGYLLQCLQLGILTNSDVEIIIERVMVAGFASVGLPEMKSFIAGFLFDNDGSNGQISLTTNDTIH
jgi:uncharacterized protein Smg (DUF494 family)